MPRFVIFGSFSRTTSLLAAIALASSLLASPILLAQRPVSHPVPAPGQVAPPHPIAPPISRPASTGPRLVPPQPAWARSGFGLAEGPDGRGMYVLRHPFFRPRPFPLWGEWWFASFSWVTCGPFWGWETGCGVAPATAYSPAPYMPSPAYQPPVYAYVYGGARNEFVELCLVDGSVFSVADYWFVNNEVHFTIPEEGSGKPGEHVIAPSDLDLQRTIDVNTRRGFRMVLRNEPWEQYLHDYPNVTPPPLAVPPKN